CFTVSSTLTFASPRTFCCFYCKPISQLRRPCLPKLPQRAVVLAATPPFPPKSPADRFSDAEGIILAAGHFGTVPDIGVPELPVHIPAPRYACFLSPWTLGARDHSEDSQSHSAALARHQRVPAFP